jgi:hypothetical protein
MNALEARIANVLPRRVLLSVGGFGVLLALVEQLADAFGVVLLHSIQARRGAAAAAAASVNG